MLLSIGQASQFIGVSVSTMRRWDRSNKLTTSCRTVGGHRRYHIQTLQVYLDPSKCDCVRKVIAYARVSSHDQKMDLVRQVKRLKKFCRQKKLNFEVIDDLGSGLNFKKRGLKRLLKLIISGQISKLIVTHKDRLLRFGNEIIYILCNFFGTQIECIEEVKNKSDEETLAHDVLEIMTVFSARLYGKRAHKNKSV